jgi:hypothetical protein
MEEATDVGRIRGDPTGAPHDLTHAFAGPGLPAKPLRLRPRVYERRRLGELVWRELGGSAWGRMATQSFLHSFRTSSREPLAHCSRCDPERGSDLCLFPARFFELPGASPPSLAPVQPGVLSFHRPSILPF